MVIFHHRRIGKEKERTSQLNFERNLVTLSRCNCPGIFIPFAIVKTTLKETKEKFFSTKRTNKIHCFEQINFKNKNIEDNIQQGRKYRYTRVAHFITLD